MDRFGHFGYAGYFILIEVLDRHGNGDAVSISQAKLSQKLRTRPGKLRELLGFCRSSSKLDWTENEFELTYSMQQFRKRQSKLKSKVRPKFPESSPNVPQEEEREEEREVKNMAAKRKPPKSETSSEVIIKKLSNDKSNGKYKLDEPIEVEPGYTITQKDILIIVAFKKLKGVDYADKEWDKANISRYRKKARAMIDKFRGDHDRAMAYLEDYKAKMEQYGLNWSFESAEKSCWIQEEK